MRLEITYSQKPLPLKTGWIINPGSITKYWFTRMDMVAMLLQITESWDYRINSIEIHTGFFN
jgi:hypothetical protein